VAWKAYRPPRQKEPLNKGRILAQLREKIADARSWRGESLASKWRFVLTAECLAALSAADDGIDLHCRAALRPVARALEAGPGFAVIDGLEAGRSGLHALQAAYWHLGRCLGEPLAQNIAGDLLYDVRDTGRDVTTGARFSVTNAESTFHNDNAFSPRIPDYVGLLCVRTARVGGRSQLISACALHDALLEEYPEILAALYGDFCFDRRGQYNEGENPVHRAPIMDWDGKELTMRYLRYYIQVGHERASLPMSAAQTEALQRVESLLRRASLRIEFELSPGQMLFVNNHWILHNRTAFEDYEDLDLRRHYIRLWLGRRGD